MPKVTIIIRRALRRRVCGDGFQEAVRGPKLRLADRADRGDRRRGCGACCWSSGSLDPTAPEVQKIRADFIEGYNLNMATPWIAAERGYIDGVIQPHETRLLLRKSLHLLRDKQNMPRSSASTA